MKISLLMRHTLAIALTIPVVTFMIVIILMQAPRLIGYRVNDAWFEVAKIAIKKKDVDICRSILNVGSHMPTTWESRVDCVREYAKTVKDPSACEGLAPHVIVECIASAMEDGPCVFSDDSIAWNENGIERIIKTERCDESGERSFMENSCCLIARTSNPDECNQLISNKSVFYECLTRVSFRNRNPEMCEEIEDVKTKEGCRLLAQPTNIRP